MSDPAEDIINAALNDPNPREGEGIVYDRNDPRVGQAKSNGQNEAYVVLSPAERAKGFVRPYRDSYVHVGKSPKYPLRDLTEYEKETFGDRWSKFEVYPGSETSKGRFWTDAELKGGCGAKTQMGRPIAETYARNPYFYGSTFCVGCGTHLPLEEFVWDGTNDIVGS